MFFSLSNYASDLVETCMAACFSFDQQKSYGYIVARENSLTFSRWAAGAEPKQNVYFNLHAEASESSIAFIRRFIEKVYLECTSANLGWITSQIDLVDANPEREHESKLAAVN